MHRSLLQLLMCLAVLLVYAGCRRAAPPSFSAGPAVDELTEDLEDAEPEEIELYKQLQKDIAVTLTKMVGTPDKPILLGTEATTDQLQHGYALYTKYCVQCHGVNGDGNGAVAEHLNPKPRNYTLGIFKFTSTPYGAKPRRSDLARTIRVGVTGTSMPSFDRFSKDQVDAVVEYVLALTYRGQLETELASYAYDDEELPDEEGMSDLVADILEPWEASSSEIIMPVSLMPPKTDESVRSGHQIFLSQGCAKCHGTYGRGGSMGNVEVGKDAWGNKAAAADLSSGMFHGGDRPIDIYRRIYAGINGTPMPAFANTFQKDPDAVWQLVHFIKEAGNRRRLGKPPLSAADMPVEVPAESAEVAEDEATDGDSEEGESEEVETEEAESEETEPAETDSEEELQPAA